MALRLVPRGLLPFWDAATRTALAALPGPRPGRRKLSPALPRHLASFSLAAGYRLRLFDAF